MIDTDKRKRDILAGIVFVSLVGTLSHFFYQLSGDCPLVGLFSPVGESTWEHVKLLFFPMLFYSLWMSARLQRTDPDAPIFAALAIGNLAGCALIPILFYTYTGILGFHLLSLDILTFFIGVLAAFYLAFRLAADERLKKYEPLLAASLLLLTLLFFLFTYYPPGIGLFAEP